MNYAEILSTLGISQGKLETIIIFTVIAIGIGIICILYWKFLLAGVFALITIFVFSHHEGNEKSLVSDIVSEVKSDTKAVAVPYVIEEVHASQAEVSKGRKTDKQKFLDDCNRLAGKPDECLDMWKEREQ